MSKAKGINNCKMAVKWLSNGCQMVPFLVKISIEVIEIRPHVITCMSTVHSACKVQIISTSLEYVILACYCTNFQL